ncbi:hypothetical protein [Leptotrichia sp. oral taxon 847]|uniref:hypothetical protein n=1 Tax=Leptotrichia sp. oral taxon 847 TaxID=1785996 RepID=UPI000767F863|nr:hypothetical protein [Leptotrichia sp. oral taxon 847]AMD94174.1 hypothetical protein AXF11_00255 [Leptotrichia sp. oral taxon 847]
MKKIFLGLFILGTLGMAQQNYEVYVKNGVKISQSEADRDSKEIDKIINDKIISRYNNEGKKVLMEKSKKLYDEYMDGLMDNMVKNAPKNQQQSFKEFLRRLSEIMKQNVFGELDKMDISIKEISFLSKNKAKISILAKYKDMDDLDSDKIIDEAFKKSGITDKDTEHFEKISKVKLDKFYKYFEDRVKEEIKKIDYNEDTTEIEIEKVDGKWQVNFDYNDLINETLKNLEDSFESMKNDIDD